MRRRHARAQLHRSSQRLERMLNRRHYGQCVVCVRVSHVVDAENVAFHRPLSAGHVNVVFGF